MFLPAYVILDLETTGGTPLYHRITEIALIRFEHGIETGRWETLVNPGISIPSFISRLTGITNEMVQDAPTFEDIAHILSGYLEGAVLAAHNVRFDYGFLKSEYRRLGAVLHQKVMCTVKLSRKLYPHHHGHSLDAIMARHGLTTQARHRAMGDVELVVAYLELAKRDLGEVRVLETVAELLKGPCLPTAARCGFSGRDSRQSRGLSLLRRKRSAALYRKERRLAIPRHVPLQQRSCFLQGYAHRPGNQAGRMDRDGGRTRRATSGIQADQGTPADSQSAAARCAQGIFAEPRRRTQSNSTGESRNRGGDSSHGIRPSVWAFSLQKKGAGHAARNSQKPPPLPTRNWHGKR